MVSGGLGRHFFVSGCSIWRSVPCTRKSGIIAVDCTEVGHLISIAFLWYETLHFLHQRLPAGFLFAYDRVYHNRRTLLQNFLSVWLFAVVMLPSDFHCFRSSLLNRRSDELLLGYTGNTADACAGEFLFLRDWRPPYCHSINPARWKSGAFRREMSGCNVVRYFGTLVWR